MCLFGLKADVKVVEIGDETVIDGIKSKWVKILLPIETIKNNRNIYGLVFGGYLTDKLEPVKLCSQLSRKRICSSVSIGISDKACMAKKRLIMRCLFCASPVSVYVYDRAFHNSASSFICTAFS